MAKQEIYQDPRRGILTRANFALPATIPVAANVLTEIGRAIVPFDSGINLGYGQATGQAEAEGRIFIDVRDNTAAPGVAIVNALIRIEIRDALNIPLAMVFEGSVEALRMGAGNRSLQLPFPERIPGASENRRIVLFILSDTAVTIGAANTIIQIDTTVLSLKKIIE